MATPTLADLRRIYYGGGSDAEYAFLQAAAAAGITAASLLSGAGAVGSELASAVDLEQRQFNNVTEDYPGLAIGPFTVPAGRVGLVHLFIPNCTIDNAADVVTINLIHGAGSSGGAGTVVDEGVSYIFGAGGVGTPKDIRIEGRLGPGTHAVKAQVIDDVAAGLITCNYFGVSRARLWAELR